MSSINTNLSQCTIDTLIQNINGIDGNNADQENTHIKPINNCDGPIDSFTGRSIELSNLSSKFNKYNIIVIHGVGGVGKTQLTRKFAADNKNNYTCLFWIQAEFKENLIKQLRELALELNIKDGMNRNLKQIRNEIYNVLKSQRALLVFDNILTEADINAYLPPYATELKNTKLHILITSQFLDWNNKTVECLELNHLEEFHALELLNKILNNELNINWANAKDKKKLVRMLEFMPLAIQIAASYINTQMKQNNTFTITRYIEKLTNNAANIHKHKHIEYGKTLGRSIEMSLDSIREDNAYATELIFIMAFFNPDSITKEVLSKILKINSIDAKEDFCVALQIIINYSLISSFNNILHLHRNIQEIVRDKLTQLDTRTFLKYYELVVDYVLNNEDESSISNTYVFNYAKDYTKFILQYYNVSKSAKLLQLLCKHRCLKNLEVIFAQLNAVNFLIERHGLLHYATLSSNIETVKIICKYNIDVNMKYEIDKTTSLHIACKHGYVDITDFLIEKGADTNIKCENGRIALHYASSGLHYDIVCRLLHISANTVEKKDKKNQTPLQLVLNTHKTNENNDKTVQIARLLVEKGANPDTANDDSYKLIHIAAHNGNYDFLAYLLNNYELDVNAKDKNGNTPLVYAVAACILISEDHIKNTMDILIKNGAKIETINNGGCSLLHVASQYRQDKFISYLIKEHNISVDTRDSFGRTPLYCALFASKQISEDNVMAKVKLLINNGADAQTITNDSRSLLHVAAEYCRDQIISYLIKEHNISVDTRDSFGRTPLYCALFASQQTSEDNVMASVKLLIENGADVETITNEGCSLLHVAAKYCRGQIISYLIKEHNISVDTRDSFGRTPLFCALFASKQISEDNVTASVRLLIENGADVETITNEGCSLLHVAAKYCRNQIISYLIKEHNIPIDTRDSFGRTPLFCALFASKQISEDNVMASVRLLIENGACVETISNNGCGLLHVAAEYCRNQIISYLIQEYNISVDTPNSSGHTPLFFALIANKSISEDDVMTTVKLLINTGANVETINNDGCSLLHIASQYCHYKIIPYLIQEYNISVDTPDNDGETPLLYAMCASKSIPEDDVMATVKLLINTGAKVETITNAGRSLLHIAAESCHYKIIPYLFQEHNISVDTPDNNGETPLYRAMFASKSIPEDDVMATVKLLIKNGANIETICNAGCSLLHIASQYCHYKIIPYLMQKLNISIDTPDNDGDSPLFCALFANKSISEGEVMATVKLLIKNGANVGMINNDGCNLLHVAAQNCRDKIITYLIQEHNISIDTPNNSGESPLFSAILTPISVSEDDILKTIKVLIEMGARVDILENKGNSLFHIAADKNLRIIMTYLFNNHKLIPLLHALLASEHEDKVMKMIELLAEKRVHKGTTHKNGTGLLHVAARYGCDKIILHLIQKYDLPVTTTDSLGRSPLFCALKAYEFVPEEDVMQTIKLLIAQGSTVEATHNTGCTILHYAALFGRYQALTYLLHNYNINIDTKDEDGDTPLHCALMADESINQETVKKIIKKLLSKGASINLKNNKDQTVLDLACPEIREFILNSYATASKRRLPEITQQTAKRCWN